MYRDSCMRFVSTQSKEFRQKFQQEDTLGIDIN